MEVQKDNLAIRFRKLCRLIAVVNSRVKAIMSSSIEGVEIARLLNAIGNDIKRRSLFLDGKNFNIHFSKGKGCVPRVLWLSFTKSGYPNSNLSVTLCFDKNGKGCVLGLMDAKERPTGKVKLVMRKTDDIFPLLDIDGPSSASMFNNSYHDPKEFFIDSFSSEEFIKHFDKNIELLFSVDN